MSMQRDPATGFMQSSQRQINPFTVEKKLKILEMINEASTNGKWPGIHRICRSLNVSPSSFYDHLDIDPDFKAAYDDALLAIEDQCVDNLIEQGKAQNGVTANIFLLKNRWPKRWNENFMLNVRGDSTQLKGLIQTNQTFIDAEFTDMKSVSDDKPK